MQGDYSAGFIYHVKSLRNSLYRQIFNYFFGKIIEFYPGET